MRFNIFDLDENVHVKIYDPSKQELIATCKNFVEASKILGISSKILREAADYKTRRFSPKLNMEIAIRVSSNKKAA